MFATRCSQLVHPLFRRGFAAGLRLADLVRSAPELIRTQALLQITDLSDTALAAA